MKTFTLELPHGDSKSSTDALAPRRFQIASPQVMGIVNVTPDSFWEGSRMNHDEQRLRERIRQIIDEGGTMVDVGAYSTRPGAQEISAGEELDRMAWALPIIREELGASVPVSVDTFRASVAEVCVKELGADIINDISGGLIDERMIPLVAEMRVPYILMHMRGTPQTMQTLTDYPDGVAAEVSRFFAQQIALLPADAQVILDPGFGFAKTLDQNYELFRALPQLCADFARFPMLVGISRKSMLFRLLGTDPSQALNGTTVLNTLAIRMGAAILRVHDVKACVEAVQICQKIMG